MYNVPFIYLTSPKTASPVVCFPWRHVGTFLFLCIQNRLLYILSPLHTNACWGLCVPGARDVTGGLHIITCGFGYSVPKSSLVISTDRVSNGNSFFSFFFPFLRVAVIRTDFNIQKDFEKHVCQVSENKQTNIRKPHRLRNIFLQCY